MGWKVFFDVKEKFVVQVQLGFVLSEKKIFKYLPTGPWVY
jgi:hypothetical protein